MGRRKRYSAESKVKVALEANCDRKHAIGRGGQPSAKPVISPNEIEKLHPKIGQLIVEYDFLS